MICLLLAASLAAPVAGDDWPRFHGLHGDGSSHETGLVHEWGEDGPPVLWSAELGPGYGGAAVRDGEVYVLDRAMSEADVMRCFDLETGEEKWSQRVEAEGRLPYPGSRSVPTVEQDYVYGMGGFGHVICCDRETGEIAWTVNVVDEFEGAMPMFGYAVSPVVWEDLVIVAPLAKEAGLVALERFSGEEMWRSDDLGSCQGSPMLVELDGVPQVLMIAQPPRGGGGGRGGPGGGRGGPGSGGGRGGFPGSRGGADRAEGEGGGGPGAAGRGGQQEGEGSGGGRRGPPGDGGGRGGFEMPKTAYLVAVDAESGEELWRGEPLTASTIVSPLLLDGGQMLLTGDENILVTRKGGDEGVSFDEVFASSGGSELHLPMFHGDHFYMVSGGGSGGMRRGSGRGATGRLICLARDGEEKWRSGEDSTYGTGNVLLADGHLYIQDGYTARLRVVEATPEGYAVKAEAQLFEEGRGDQQAWAPMALAQGRLLIRSQDTLHCVDLRAGQ